MDRVYLAHAAATPPATPGTSRGYPTDGDGLAVEATAPGAYNLHMLMEELLAVIDWGGVTPDATVLTQVRDAIAAKIDGLGWATGDIKFSAGTVVPAGWLACEGSILAPGSHEALRAFLGTRFAVPGDPPGTVRLPDARRAALVGAGGVGTSVLGATVGSRGGAETHTLITPRSRSTITSCPERLWICPAASKIGPCPYQTPALPASSAAPPQAAAPITICSRPWSR